MVVASPTPIGSEKLIAVEVPIIDLAARGPKVAELIVKASQEYGFFKVINHGVPEDVIRKMEEESFNFFGKPDSEKKKAGPAQPFGYGCKNIGFNGDMGEVEYLLFNTNPHCISQRSETISNDPTKFRYFSLVSLSQINLRVLPPFVASIPLENFRVLRGFILYIHRWPNLGKHQKTNLHGRQVFETQNHEES